MNYTVDAGRAEELDASFCIDIFLVWEKGFRYHLSSVASGKHELQIAPKAGLGPLFVQSEALDKPMPKRSISII